MDSEILTLNDRIEIALQLSESHFREFKSGCEGTPSKKITRSPKDICVDIAQTLVAFANADGGELLVGVEDNGIILGLDFDEKIIHMLLNAPKTHVHKDTPLPSTRAIQTTFKGKKILYFSVPKGTDYVYLTSNGRCLQRKDKESVPISSEDISFSRTEIISREYDRAFIDGAKINDLQISVINQVAKHISKGMSAEKCLQHLELAEFDGSRLRLRRAALLLFAKNPNKWHPRIQVRILRINGTEIKSGEEFNVVKDEEVTDNIIRLIESSWELLLPHLTETRFSKDAIFRTQIIYPELACREALINAIAHRDYSMEGRGIEVQVFSDRLEIISPGGLLSSIKIQDLKELKGVHQSRNSLITKVLREMGYMRELGEGIRRIYNLMNSNDLASPELYADNNIFSVVLHHKYIYSPEEKIWLDNFNKYNLNREQKIIVRLGYNEHVISPHEIWEAVGIVDTDEYRQLLESLQKLGILYRSVSKSRVSNKAKINKISKKGIPQFSIRIPVQIPVGSVKEEQTDNIDYAKIFVTNIPYDSTESELIEIFNQFGDVVNVSIPTNYETGLARGFAFVEFERLESSNRAIQESGRIFYKGRHLYTQKFSKA
ncbi:MAG: ATP-binding protein [Methanosarcinales archaeon]|nr:ATP-binding protein [Methanosarcinales archaeon]